MLVSSPINIPLADFSSGKNWNEIFGHSGPLKVEICSGKDEFLIKMAEREPASRFVGIERSRAMAQKLVAKIERSELTNIRVISEPAEYVVEDAFTSNLVETFFINFPDPWPKKRHHKRRLISPLFTKLLADRLVPGGEIQFVSDHRDYVQWALPIFSTTSFLENCFGGEGFRLHLDDYPPTLYMKKYQREGRPFYFLRFQKKPFAD